MERGGECRGWGVNSLRPGLPEIRAVGSKNLRVGQRAAEHKRRKEVWKCRKIPGWSQGKKEIKVKGKLRGHFKR